MGERLEVLHQLQRNEISLLVVPVDSFMQCVVPRHELSDQTFSFEIGENIEREFLETCLLDNGFVRMPMVENRGHFSVRGDIIDVYPPSSTNPLRIEFFDNTIESIREFDVNTQVSLKNIKKFENFPVKELISNCGSKGRWTEKNLYNMPRNMRLINLRLKELIDKIKHLDSFFGLEHSSRHFSMIDERRYLNTLSNDSLVVLDEEDRCYF